MSLTSAQLRSRRRFEYDVLRAMTGEVVQSTAHADPRAMASGRDPIIDPQHALFATCYVVTLHVPTLVGPTATRRSTTIAINARVPDYPFAPPLVWAVHRPVPWNPHFHPDTGVFCIADAWDRERGTTLLGDVIVHLARLLNWDEQRQDRTYVGWNAPAAQQYWQQRAQPLNRHQPLPRLPRELLHDLV